MRLALMILCLAGAPLLAFASCMSAIADSNAGVSWYASLFWLLAGAFAWGRPRASTWLLAIAALLGLVGILTSDSFGWVWLVLSIALLVLGHFAERELAERRTAQPPKAPTATD